MTQRQFEFAIARLLPQHASERVLRRRRYQNSPEQKAQRAAYEVQRYARDSQFRDRKKAQALAWNRANRERYNANKRAYSRVRRARITNAQWAKIQGKR